MNDFRIIADAEQRIRAAIKRSGISKKDFVARMDRITRAAGMLLNPRVRLPSLAPPHGVTTAELYGAFFMLIIADTFRDGERPGIVGDFLQLTEADMGVLHSALVLLHERYFGFPPQIEA